MIPRLSRVGFLLLLLTGPIEAASLLQQQSASQEQRTNRVTPPAISQGCTPTVPELKRVASAEWLRTHDGDQVLAAVDAAIGPGAGDMTEFVTLGHEGLLFTVSFPSRTYRWRLSEALRKREPIEAVTAPSTVTVEVAVTRVDADDIEKVIVERDGKVVPPVAGSLRLTKQVSRLGIVAVLHEGRLSYPCAAFAPGASVRVIGIPASGDNLERSFTLSELERLTGRRLPKPTTAGELVGRDAASIIELLPKETATILDDGFGYATTSGAVLRLTIQHGVITKVSDSSLSLADLREPAIDPNPPMGKPPEPKEPGYLSFAKCGDGTFIYYGGNCKGRSGVAEIYRLK